VGGACGTHGRGEKHVQGLVGKPEGKRPLGRSRRKRDVGLEWTLGRFVGGCGVDSPGSGQGPVAGCCECGDEPPGSGATELVMLYIIPYVFR
jgi:hypothetical protein